MRNCDRLLTVPQDAKLTAFVPNSDSPSGILEGGFLKDIGAPVEQDAANARPDLSVNALASFNGTGVSRTFGRIGSLGLRL
jgi:hypothetical protein